MVTYDQIKKANDTLKLTPIKDKDYAQVNQRIKGFRMVYPDGFIITDMKVNSEGLCIFTASVGYYDEHGQAQTIGTGTAFEERQSSYINKTSYIENCETSAVGRALGMAGFGIDTSICSAEELSNALEVEKELKKSEAKQLKPDYDTEKKPAPNKIELIRKNVPQERINAFLNKFGLERLEDADVMQLGIALNVFVKEGYLK